MSTNLDDLPKKSLLRPDEVAHFFGISIRTVYNWVDFGDLEGVKPPSGRTVRITRESVKKIALQNESSEN